MERVRSARWPLLSAYDLCCWILGFGLVAVLQQMGSIGLPDGVLHAALSGVACGLAFLLIGAVVKLHQGRTVVGSFEDLLLVVTIAGLVSALSLVVDIALGPFYRLTVAVMAPVAALALMVWGRAVFRVAREREHRVGGGSTGAVRERVVVIGAGEAARQLVQSIRRDPKARWQPVALVDDDPLKRHRRLAGISVLGRVKDFPEVASSHNAGAAILAIPSASAELVRGVTDLAMESSLDLKVLPSTNELVDPRRAGIGDVRDIEVSDLLGRHVIDTDVSSIAGYLTGKRVLVTGAGGSIGSELCRQIEKFGPAELIMLDRDESALHAVQLSIHGKAMLDGDDTVLADIRDAEFINHLFEVREPQVVFHAAALKHLPLLEKAPGEAVKTNVWGTLNVLEAAAGIGVERFVNISTDKAANPISVLGYSKRLAEGLTAAIARRSTGTYLSVRFGNVLGSRGSVLTAFAKQIADGGPVTVTDPHVTRYFMTTEEAVQLVIQAAAIGNDGEALVLDMGEPVSIDAVARQLIDISGNRDVDIVYTGLRAGEKLHEDLLGDNEVDERPCHSLISHTGVPVFEPLDARAVDAWAPAERVIARMQASCSMMAQRTVQRGRGVFSA